MVALRQTLVGNSVLIGVMIHPMVFILKLNNKINKGVFNNDWFCENSTVTSDL